MEDFYQKEVEVKIAVANIMGRVDKGVKCVIVGCKLDAVRSISVNKVKATRLEINEGRRAYLCKEHYREFKKRNKDFRKVERWRWNT